MSDYLKNLNVLVTGGSGLIGNRLLSVMSEKGIKNLYAIEHNNSKKIGGVIYFTGNLLDSDFCKEISTNMDIVFHCAAVSYGAKVMEEQPLVFVKDNIMININMLEACYKNKVKKFLYLSSTTGYPYSEDFITEDQMFVGDPYDKYFPVGWMKRYTEKLCQLFSEKLKYPMTCIVLRPTNIFGPGDKVDINKCHVLPALIQKVITKQNPIEIWGDGTDERDILYVDDMVDAMILASEKLNRFEQINIGYRKTYTILDMLEIIKKVENYDAPYKFIPTGPRMIPLRRVDTTKSKNLLGWEPKVSVEDGILLTYNWYKSELNIK